MELNFKMVELSILMPAYNEGKKIKENLEETKKTLNSFKIDYEIILINDASKDNTLNEANKVKGIKILSYEKNGGKGNALKYGFQFAKGDLICFLDSDLELHPSLIKSFIDIISKTKADVVIGSKRHPDSLINYPLKRRILSWGYSTFVKFLFGLNVRDTQTGIKLFRKEVLDKVFPKVLIKRYAFSLEVLVNAHKLGYRIVEAPIILNFKRAIGEKRLGFKSIFPMFKDTLAIAYRLYILRYYDRK